MNTVRTVLDIWNWYIKGVVFATEDGVVNVLAKDMVKTRGMRKWKILDIEDFALCVNELLKSFERKIWSDLVEEVIVGVSHPQSHVIRVAEQKRIINKTILSEDVSHLSDIVADAWYKPNYEVIKIMPVLWLIDEETKTKDPLWMDARKLELIADVFLLPKVYYNNLMEVFKKLDLDVRDMVPTILWTCEWVLDFDLKDLGSLVIDIGANQTSYAVYEEWYPLFYGVIPLGGEDVTKDLSIGLQIDVKEAEALKREKASIAFDKVSQSDETIDMKFMTDIVIARYEEIFDLIQEDLIHRDKDWRLPWWVFLTWWASKIPDLELLSKDVFKVASFSAQERHLQIGELHENHQFLSLLGLYSRSDKYSYNKRKWLGLSLDFWFIQPIKDFFKKLF